MDQDIASLILLAMISSAESDALVEEPVWGPKTGVWAVLIPLFTSFGYILVGLGFALATLRQRAVPVKTGQNRRHKQCPPRSARRRQDRERHGGDPASGQRALRLRAATVSGSRSAQATANVRHRRTAFVH